MRYWQYTCIVRKAYKKLIKILILKLTSVIPILGFTVGGRNAI